MTGSKASAQDGGEAELRAALEGAGVSAVVSVQEARAPLFVSYVDKRPVLAARLAQREEGRSTLLVELDVPNAELLTLALRAWRDD